MFMDQTGDVLEATWQTPQLWKWITTPWQNVFALSTTESIHTAVRQPPLVMLVGKLSGTESELTKYAMFLKAIHYLILRTVSQQQRHFALV